MTILDTVKVYSNTSLKPCDVFITSNRNIWAELCIIWNTFPQSWKFGNVIIFDCITGIILCWYICYICKGNITVAAGEKAGKSWSSSVVSSVYVSLTCLVYFLVFQQQHFLPMWLWISCQQIPTPIANTFPSNRCAGWEVAGQKEITITGFMTHFYCFDERNWLIGGSIFYI